jgi:chromosomal replication initiator protein
VNQTNEDQWDRVLSILESRLSKACYETWLKSTKAKKESNQWFIMAPNDFSRDWLEARYQFDIKEAIYTLTNESPILSIIVDDHTAQSPTIHPVEEILFRIESLCPEEKERLLSLIKTKYF